MLYVLLTYAAITIIFSLMIMTLIVVVGVLWIFKILSDEFHKQ